MEPITIGEVWRRLGDDEHDNQAKFKAIDDRMSRDLVPRDFYHAEHRALQDRLKRLEDQYIADQTWRRNLTVGTVVTFLTATASIIAGIVH